MEKDKFSKEEMEETAKKAAEIAARCSEGKCPGCWYCRHPGRNLHRPIGRWPGVYR